MLTKVKGIVEKKLADSVLVTIGGLGLRVFLPTRLLGKAEINKDIELFTKLQIREEEVTLYGFSSFEELRMFEMLISVSGVGPKMAMGVLSSSSVKEIEEAVLQGNVELFTNVSGIGKKNAGRIILELRSKLGSIKEFDLGDLGQPEEINEVIEVLQSFGYRRSEIRETLRSVDKNLPLELKIKESLKILGKHKFKNS